MTGTGWPWVCGWLAAAALIPAAIGYAVTRWRERRIDAAIRQAHTATHTPAEAP